MRLLVLGGTVFLGRHLVDAALARGHELTLFHRGRHGADLFPGVERLLGDRDGDLSQLRRRRWDAVVDTSGHVPRVVRASAELLADATEHYTVVSTLAVYADFPRRPGIDESCPLGATNPTSERVTLDTVGPLKALCERAAEEAMPGRALAVRSGFLVGPCDPADRFSYWPRRVAQGGEMLAPAGPETPVQLIDARDLASWMVRMAESRRTGAYNATGPEYRLPLQRLLEVCTAETRGDATFTWADEEFLVRAGVTLEFPLYIPRAPGAGTVDCSRAIAAGLAFRPLTDTVRDTLTWSARRPPGVPRGAGLDLEREACLLRAWHAARELRTPRAVGAPGTG